MKNQKNHQEWKVDHHTNWIVLEKPNVRVCINKYTGAVSLSKRFGGIMCSVAGGSVGVCNDDEQIHRAKAWASWQSPS